MVAEHVAAIGVQFGRLDDFGVEVLPQQAPEPLGLVSQSPAPAARPPAPAQTENSRWDGPDQVSYTLSSDGTRIHVTDDTWLWLCAAPLYADWFEL